MEGSPRIAKERVTLAKNVPEKRMHAEHSTDYGVLLVFDEIEIEFEPRD